MRGENDLTVALQDIVRANNDLGNCIAGKDEAKIMLAWDKLQIFCAAIINQNAKKLLTYNGTTVVHIRAMSKRKTKVIKERLTGKKGRLRGNLSGKRVDQAGRSVVGPDASHDIFQLGVPASIMRTLTFPEHVNALNKEILGAAVVRGAGAKEGALTVRMPEGAGESVLHVSLLDEQGRRSLAAQLKPGWTVERHLKDGDWVLFNRQPSLHKASIMAFQAYETKSSQFKLPLPCTKPFNADFDGDEMNLHALQDYTALAEAQEIMAVPHQMVTPQSNAVIIALVQDGILGAFMMSRRDAFCTKERAMQLAMEINYCAQQKDYSEMPNFSAPPLSFVDTLGGGLPMPAIIKCPSGQQLWTGKQILSWTMPNALSLTKGINGAEAGKIEDIMEDGVVIVRLGQLLAGRLCKQTVGNSTGGLVQALWKELGPWAAAKFISDAQRVLMQWLKHDTICISIRDCLTSNEAEVDELSAEAMGKVDDIANSDVPAEVKEIRQTQLLQESLRIVGAKVLSGMDHNSGIATVVASGSKGNLMNIAQIAGLVGQQTINGSRIAFRAGPNGPRTLCNFFPGDNSPEARGFVASSYLMGLQPSEFFFHQQGGREGVVATAVSTADTGYNQRRMVKNQESEVVAYDLSVRVSSNLMVQQHYGGDDYDGTLVERVKLPMLDMTEKECAKSFLRASVPMREKHWFMRCRKMLCEIKDGIKIYGAERMAEVCMPVHFGRMLTSFKIGSGGQERCAAGEKPAQCFSLLKGLLKKILESHGTPCEGGDDVEDLLFLPRRNSIVHDDPSLQARLCLGLLCTSKRLENEYVLESEEKQICAKFFSLYAKALVNPGEGVGAVGSSSIGEPSTQMTLNIFHYSGIAEKNVTLTGLPRFKQIINAVDTYETSNMSIALTEAALGSREDDKKFKVRAFSSRLARTFLSQLVTSSRVLHCQNTFEEENEIKQDASSESLGMRLETLSYLTLNFANSSEPLKNQNKGSSSSSAAGGKAKKTSVISERVQTAIKGALSSSSSGATEEGIEEAAKKKKSRLSTYLAEYELSKDQIYSRYISLDEVGNALAALLGRDAQVTWSAKWSRDWMIWVRPPSFGGEHLDKAVTDAIHDALLEQS